MQRQGSCFAYSRYPWESQPNSRGASRSTTRRGSTSITACEPQLRDTSFIAHRPLHPSSSLPGIPYSSETCPYIVLSAIVLVVVGIIRRRWLWLGPRRPWGINSMKFGHVNHERQPASNRFVIIARTQTLLPTTAVRCRDPWLTPVID